MAIIFGPDGLPMVEIRDGEHPVAAENKCRVCGCTDDDCFCCIMHTGGPCYWIEDDLCSACAPCKG